MSLQLCCGNMYRIWMWFKWPNLFLRNMNKKMSITVKIMNWALVTPTLGHNQDWYRPILPDFVHICQSIHCFRVKCYLNTVLYRYTFQKTDRCTASQNLKTLHPLQCQWIYLANEVLWKVQWRCWWENETSFSMFLERSISSCFTIRKQKISHVANFIRLNWSYEAWVWKA